MARLAVLQQRDGVREPGLALVERRNGGKGCRIGRLEGDLEHPAQIHQGVGTGDAVRNEADGQAPPGVQDRHARR